MDFASARRHMVESQVRTNDVTDLRLQAAMEETPREAFLPAGLRALAYVEREFDIAPGRWLLTARDFSKLVAAAEPVETDIVLDVACASGYSTAILARLCEMVVAVEADEALAAGAGETLAALDIANAATIAGDPAKGAPGQGPFDLIVIASGAVEVEPDALFAQLKDGGRLAMIRRENGVSRGVICRRSGEAVTARRVFDAACRAALPEFAAPRKFVF